MVEPKIWGPSYWNAIHYSAINATTKIKKDSYVKYIDILPILLPCASCTEHLLQNLKQFPVRNFMASEETLFKWSWMLHDLVNIQTHKPYRMTYEEAKKKYATFEDGTCSLGDCSGETTFKPRPTSKRTVIVKNINMPKRTFRPMFIPSK